MNSPAVMVTHMLLIFLGIITPIALLVYIVTLTMRKLAKTKPVLPAWSKLHRWYQRNLNAFDEWVNIKKNPWIVLFDLLLGAFIGSMPGVVNGLMSIVGMWNNTTSPNITFEAGVLLGAIAGAFSTFIYSFFHKTIVVLYKRFIKKSGD